MPYSFILQIIFFVSLGTVVIIIARGLPRIEDEMMTKRSIKGRFETFIKKIPIEKMDDFLNIFFHKGLRRLKVIILKADNIVSGKMHGLKKASEKKNITLPTSGLDS